MRSSVLFCVTAPSPATCHALLSLPPRCTSLSAERWHVVAVGHAIAGECRCGRIFERRHRYHRRYRLRSPVKIAIYFIERKSHVETYYSWFSKIQAVHLGARIARLTMTGTRHSSNRISTQIPRIARLTVKLHPSTVVTRITRIAKTSAAGRRKLKKVPRMWYNFRRFQVKHLKLLDNSQ